MKVYRCITNKEYNCYNNGDKCLIGKRKTFGTNTFQYADKDYIHFFLFAESADNFQYHPEMPEDCKFMECDIPWDILKNYLGYGYYTGVVAGYYAPMPEFCIPVDIFEIEYINEFSDKIKETWKQDYFFKKYISNLYVEYMADNETGYFMSGYDVDSVKDFDIYGAVLNEMLLQDSQSKRVLSKNKKDNIK